MLLPRFLAKDQWRRRLFNIGGTVDFPSQVFGICPTKPDSVDVLESGLRSGWATGAIRRDPRALQNTLGVLRNVNPHGSGELPVTRQRQLKR